MKRLLQVYSYAVALVATPALLAAVLAWTLGYLPSFGDLRDAVAQVREQAPEDTSARPATPVDEAAESGDDEEEPPVDGIVWQERFQQYEARIVEREKRLEAESTRIEERESELDALRVAIGEVSGAILERAVDPEDLVAQKMDILEELRRVQRETNSLPGLLEMVRRSEPSAVAQLIAAGDLDANGLDEATSARLLRALPARTSAKVLDELSRVDARLASRLVARLTDDVAKTEAADSK